MLQIIGFVVRLGLFMFIKPKAIAQLSTHLRVGSDTVDRITKMLKRDTFVG